ncbi:O-Methyltransferase involved in polyketide biosynthesis [Bacillus cereus]|nr:O-Methyltransferase involved in polyketide biosynthesis [Bacillus cereus]
MILGAGLDTFSFRHRELENKIEVFEVDHPSTQQFKKERIKEAELEVPNHLHFVSMDFTKGFSYEQLQNEGFENKKTFFSLLGVCIINCFLLERSNYLTDKLYQGLPSR